MMAQFVLQFANIFIMILYLAVIGRALLSWFPIDPANPLVRVLNEITEPVLAPLRRVIPRLGMIDISPMVAIVVLMVVQQAIQSTLAAG